MTLDINYHAMGIWYKIMGALIVTVCVITISLSDVIQEKVPEVCRRYREGYQSLDETANLISSETTDETGRDPLDYGSNETMGS